MIRCLHCGEMNERSKDVCKNCGKELLKKKAYGEPSKENPNSLLIYTNVIFFLLLVAPLAIMHYGLHLTGMSSLIGKLITFPIWGYTFIQMILTCISYAKYKESTIFGSIMKYFNWLSIIIGLCLLILW